MSGVVSNPFCTRFVRPGAIAYQFAYQFDKHGIVEHGTVSDQGNPDPLGRLTERILAARRSLIVGPHGSGKSTLVQSLRPQLEVCFCEVIEVHLITSQPSRRPVFEASKRLQSGGLLIVDGIEQLALWDRMWLLWRLKRCEHWLLATSHEPLRGFTTLHSTRLSAHQMIELTKQLVAALPENERKTILCELSKRSLGKETNLRDLWFDCYDLIERMRSQAGGMVSRKTCPK